MFWLWIALAIAVVLAVTYFAGRRFEIGPWHDRKERDTFHAPVPPKGTEQLPPSSNHLG